MATAYPTSLTTTTWTGTADALTDASDSTYLESPAAPTSSDTFLAYLWPVGDPGVDTDHALVFRAINTDTLTPLDLVLTVENVDDGSVVMSGVYSQVVGAYAINSIAISTIQAALIHSYSGLRVRGYARATPYTYFVWEDVPTADSYTLEVWDWDAE